jgi:hypothetical protein
MHTRHRDETENDRDRSRIVETFGKTVNKLLPFQRLRVLHGHHRRDPINAVHGGFASHQRLIPLAHLCVRPFSNRCPDNRRPSNHCPEQPRFLLADLTECKRDCSSEARSFETKKFSRDTSRLVCNTALIAALLLFAVSVIIFRVMYLHVTVDNSQPAPLLEELNSSTLDE